MNPLTKQQTEKRCSQCGDVKPVSEFTFKQFSSCGFRLFRQPCKKCYRENMRSPEKKVMKRRIQKKYDLTENGQATRKRSGRKYRQTVSFKIAIEKYRLTFPEKRRAQIAVTNALQCGKIIRPSHCSICGIVCKPEAHHPDYAFPLEIIWVCKRCHSAYHWSN